MREEMVMELPALYRDSFRIKSFLFGAGEKSVCIVGAQRGNEYQQICFPVQIPPRSSI